MTKPKPASRIRLFGRAHRAQLVSRWEYSTGAKFEQKCLICEQLILRTDGRFWAQGYGARHEHCSV